MKPAEPGAVALALYRRESLSWGLIGFTLGLVEGATAAVLLKKQYEGQASPEVVNLAVAFVSGAPALSNVVSFLWANLAHGRERVRLMVALFAGFALLVGLIGLSPRASHGLTLTVLSVIAARVLWSGILTVRSAVWTANYPRTVLARITGRIVVVTSLGIAAAAALAGWLLESRPEFTRWLYAAAALSGLVAAWLYRQMRVRREYALISAENAALGQSQVFSLGVMRQILRDDPAYRRYMAWLGVYGAGNLMLSAQFVIVFSDQLQLSSAKQIGVLAIVPLLSIPLFTPWWARQFDAGHVIEYRARQCWALIAAIALLILAVFTRVEALLWFGALMLGASTAGANLGWNLGHSDFASLGRMQQYMGVNVTLTGMRGLIAPPAGVLVYEALERVAVGAGRYALLLPLGMTLLGAWGFNSMKEGARRTPRGIQ
ncbi:MAG: MFS transporter [Steroidobacteraceae bacterium]